MTDEGAASGGAKSDKDDTTSKAQSKTAPSKTEDAITALKNDHRKVEALFQSYQQSSGRTDKQKLARQICQELIVHTKLEEEIFYRACRENGVEDDMLDEAQVEHDGAKILINELLSGNPQDEYYDAKVKVLSEEIKHHVNEEEKRDGIFAKAKSAGLDLEEVGQKLAARKAELLEEIEQNGLERPRPRSFKQRGTENTMPQGQYRDRDERGRFMSDDDDDRRYSSRGSMGRERDERGRFMSDDDDDRRSYSSRSGGGRSRYEDDDGRRYAGSRSEGARRSGDRGQGGWFGDPQGHSEASRRGWDHSDHEGSGWYGDPQGHSQASRRGWERSDHEGSGWYGDPEGHSEAARRGWGESTGSRGRSRYEEDDRRYSRSSSRNGGSRYEDDDDDRRSSRASSRGRTHGGWFGDPEGHSEASRRGWENR